MDQQQQDDQLLASAVQFLLDGGEERTAAVLLSCTLTYEEIRVLTDDDFAFVHMGYETGRLQKTITLVAPRATYDVLAFLNTTPNYYFDAELRADEEPERLDICDAIRAAFFALIDRYVRFAVKASRVTITEHWREELLSLLRGNRVTNQGLQFSPQPPVLTWNNLRFRSQTEIRMAEALERAQVLFLPNCMARLGFSQRQNREADFLVCQKGRWGILEVDSPTSHPPTRTVEDHERDRLFKAHGIRVVEHFDAAECWENADGIVKKFLYLLGR